MIEFFSICIGQIYPPINVLPSLSRLMKVRINLLFQFPIHQGADIFKMIEAQGMGCVLNIIIGRYCRVPLVRG